jgi:hypothetical protein
VSSISDPEGDDQHRAVEDLTEDLNGQPDVEREYGELLDNIVKNARVASFPSQEPLGYDEMSNRLSSNSNDGSSKSDSIRVTKAFGVYLKNPLKYNFKIGAARELFLRCLFH